MIRFEAVSKIYPDGTVAVDHLDLEAPSGQITGQLDRIQGDIYTVKDPAGREVTFRVDKDTKWEGSPKVGDQVEASIAPDGSADYVRKISGAKNRGSSGSESSPPFGR